MSMLSCPQDKYTRRAPLITLQKRDWPSNQISIPPIWLTTDLRDGNQSLVTPMTVTQKLKMFKMLCDIGFKEIEVGFPSASSTEMEFVRTLIEGKHIPSDVTIGVLTPARAHLIEATIEALKGVDNAIVHVYAATSPLFRNVVFGKSKEDVTSMIIDAVTLVKQLVNAKLASSNIILEYSPETFTDTELEFAREVCDSVVEAWEGSPSNKVIINLPATVEHFMPNVFADQVEWMHKNLRHRDSIVLSLHPHNDRGTGVAAAEMGLLAGADRVEGCLFGHGERTGNVDLVTLALNLYSQGIHPNLDFSNIDEVISIVEECTAIPVHQRHPYAGSLVYTAFSGSHQDAIKKGFDKRSSLNQIEWDVPYLPIDPADLGRGYEAIIRVNSQSGKGGAAFILESVYGISVPRKVQVEFSKIVQQLSESQGVEVSAAQVWKAFFNEYMRDDIKLLNYEFNSKSGKLALSLESPQGKKLSIISSGNGPIDAAVRALKAMGFEVNVKSFEESSVTPSIKGGEASACSIVEIESNGESRVGVGVDFNIVTAGIKAILAAVVRF